MLGQRPDVNMKLAGLFTRGSTCSITTGVAKVGQNEELTVYDAPC